MTARQREALMDLERAIYEARDGLARLSRQSRQIERFFDRTREHQA